MAKRTWKRPRSPGGAASARGRGGDYEVGYCRPPRETQFQPGNRANPKGRPKGAKSTATMAREALERPVLVSQNGSQRKMTVRQLAYRKLADKAAMGDQKALTFLITLAGEHESLETGTTNTVTSENDLKIINDFLDRKTPERSL